MSWGNAEWDKDCESKLYENLFSPNDSAKKKKRRKRKNKPSDSLLGAAVSVGRFVRINPTTDYNDTSSVYVKPKGADNRKRKLSAKDNKTPKKIKLGSKFTLNNVSDDTARRTNSGSVTVDGKNQSQRQETRKIKRKKNIPLGVSDESKCSPKQNGIHIGSVAVDRKEQSQCQKTKKRKRKKHIPLGMSDESKCSPKQKKIDKTYKDVQSVSSQSLNESNVPHSSDFEKIERNHKISVDSNFLGSKSHIKKRAPEPKNMKVENSQHPTATIKSKSPYKIKQLKKYLKKHVSSSINITPTQNPANSLREKMMKRLQASHFRYINEQLYNSKSEESKTFFQHNNTTFEAYHEGYRQQVSKWPLNPLSVIINALKKKPSETVIADFGCGEALLAKLLPDHKVYSFDFVATSDVVTPCDMSNTPLENECVDIVVFCLSLMGSNLSSYILEANRVLRNGGMMMIAEVESRFEKIDTFIQDIKKFGFANTWKDFSHKIFYFLYFKKVSSVKKTNKLPSISLKACLYKKR